MSYAVAQKQAAEGQQPADVEIAHGTEGVDRGPVRPERRHESIRGVQHVGHLVVERTVVARSRHVDQQAFGPTRGPGP